MIRAAIVGIGRWGRMLVNSVQDKSTEIRFTAGHTRTRASAEAFCADNGIVLQDDLAAILADPAIDAVVFATPHSQHAAQVEQTAAAGKHVFMEKPFTLDVKSAEAALDAIARAGVVLGVAYPRRFHPAMIELKRGCRTAGSESSATARVCRRRPPVSRCRGTTGAVIRRRRRPAR